MEENEALWLSTGEEEEERRVEEGNRERELDGDNKMGEGHYGRFTHLFYSSFFFFFFFFCNT